MKSIFQLFALLAFSSLIACAHKGGHEGHEGHHGHHGKGGACSHKEGGGHWKMMDANNDDVVTKQEFEAAGLEKFKKLDANNDGKITKEEKMAAHADKGDGKKSCCQ